jgi:hypothetical protein
MTLSRLFFGAFSIEVYLLKASGPVATACPASAEMKKKFLPMKSARKKKTNGDCNWLFKMRCLLLLPVKCRLDLRNTIRKHP